MFLFSARNYILIFLAVVPAVYLLVRVYKADRLEREPEPLLLSLVLWGILATFAALLAEEALQFILSLVLRKNSLAYCLVFYGLAVGFAEEGAKYYVLRRRTWNSPYFDCQFDGMVYSVFVSMGFALWENISYVTRYGFATGLIRAVTAVPGHACFGVFMGAFYGLAKRLERENRREEAKLARIFAVVLPALIHGCYDYIAVTASYYGSWLFYIFIVLLFLISLAIIRRGSNRDRYI